MGPWGCHGAEKRGMPSCIHMYMHNKLSPAHASIVLDNSPQFDVLITIACHALSSIVTCSQGAPLHPPYLVLTASPGYHTSPHAREATSEASLSFGTAHNDVNASGRFSMFYRSHKFLQVTQAKITNTDANNRQNAYCEVDTTHISRCQQATIIVNAKALHNYTCVHGSTGQLTTRP